MYVCLKKTVQCLPAASTASTPEHPSTMGLLAVANTAVHRYPQTVYILIATLATTVFAGWWYTSRETVPPESRRIAAFLMACAHLFAYNLFLLFASDSGQHVWACVFTLVLVMCVVMAWPLPPEYDIGPGEDDNDMYRAL